MEFSCEKKELQNGISLVEKIVATRSTLPIIGNILLEAGKNGLRLSANNLEMGMELAVEAKVSKGGAVLLSAKTLSGLVSKLPDTNVSFKLTEKGTLRVSYKESHFNVNTLPADEFPALPKIKEGRTVCVDPLIFISMIKQTIFAVSSNEDKYILTGVLMEIGESALSGDQSNLRLVSTDGYRMAKKGGRAKLEGAKAENLIIPAKALQELARIIEPAKGDEELKIAFAADQVSFKYREAYLVSRVIQGQFPDYKQVIPKKTSVKILVKREELLEAAERAAVIAAGSANVVRFEFKGGSLHLLASTPDVGDIDEIVEAEIKGKEKVQIAFNIRLVVDVLKVLEGDGVAVEFTDTLGPGVIKPDGKEDFLYIVMPIRTQEAA